MSTSELSVPLEPRDLAMTETARAFRRPDGARGRPACHQRSVPWTRDQFLGI